MTAPSFRDIRRPLTPREIAVREKVWAASVRQEGVTLTVDEVGDLWDSILQTGRELSALRDVIDFQEACN